MRMVFCQEWVHLDRKVGDLIEELPEFFPSSGVENFGIIVTEPSSMFGVAKFMSGHMQMFELFDHGWYVPRYIFRDGQREDNVSPEILEHYRDVVGADVSADDIFYYAYGTMYDPDPAARWSFGDAGDFEPMLQAPVSAARFHHVAAVGRALSDLHRRHDGDDLVEPYPLDIQIASGVDAEAMDTWHMDELRWSDDHTTIYYNDHITLVGIPPEAERFMLGPRPILDWVVVGYSKVPDVNDLLKVNEDPRFIVDHIQRVTTIAVDSMRLIDTL